MPDIIDKVCPVLLRQREGRTQILAFRHPLAGGQLIKGTLEAGEEPESAVLRELAEESGIDDATVVESLDCFLDPEHSQRWHIFLCRVERPLPDEWSFYTADGGGHIFAFFWHDLDETPGDDWYPLFRRALAYIQTQLAQSKTGGRIRVNPANPSHPCLFFRVYFPITKGTFSCQRFYADPLAAQATTAVSPSLARPRWDESPRPTPTRRWS